ncbi:MAG: haloacid dehalogenase-like hydrolase [Erysipelotrichaceae bacterium]
MNVYDWDKTIYQKDSTEQFYLFCFKKHPFKMIKCLPENIKGFVLYFLKKIDLTEMKKHLYVFLKQLDDVDELLKQFWDENIVYINDWYKKNHRDDDVVISASPYFLVKEGCDRLQISKLIASQVDKNTGEVLSPNCNRQQKVIRFVQEGYDLKDIDQFYSDSYSDVYLAREAKQPFLVVKGKVEVWDKLD